MFGLFKKDAYKVETVAPVADFFEPKTNTAAHYTIGITTDDQTQLTVGREYKMTLTMNNVAVAHMIKLLAVNISDEYEVTVKKIKPAVDDMDPTDLETDAI